MCNADINDPSSIERIYPRAVFLREAHANARAKASVLRGLRILAAPDAAGKFELVRAARHAGEADSPGGAVFLCPFAQAAISSAAQYPAAAGPPPAAPPEAADPYLAFLDRVIATARSAPVPEPTGSGDPRR
ncbi:MAG TPA: hypothetical protein VE397_22030, partial [Stellaceae bacterium]|nr:hypothetical protein [Stellaceae bacterium]